MASSPRRHHHRGQGERRQRLSARLGSKFRRAASATILKITHATLRKTRSTVSKSNRSNLNLCTGWNPSGLRPARSITAPSRRSTPRSFTHKRARSGPSCGEDVQADGTMMRRGMKSRRMEQEDGSIEPKVYVLQEGSTSGSTKMSMQVAADG